MVMKCLNLQDYQAKTHNYRKGLTYLKNRASTNQNQTLHSQKMKRKILKQKIIGDHPTKKKGRMENHRINWKMKFKMAINNHLSIITLNVNGLNAPIKRHRVAEWIKKQKPSICCLQETHFRAMYTYRLKSEGMEKRFHANRHDRKAGIAILISDEIDFKTKDIKTDKEGHYLMTKGSIQGKDIILVNIYAPNIGAPKYIQQILTDIKGETDGGYDESSSL